MKPLCVTLSLLIALALSATLPTAAQAPTAQAAPLRVIAFGAHPDDAELKAAGVASLWAQRGAKVKLVAMTNGDVGHFEQAGGPLARRRKAEVQECARIFGTAVDVLDIHDGELEPTLENRRTVSRLIRDWQADIVMSHRPYDYHPDHRYTGVLADDSAIVVMAPFFVPDTPPTRRNPVFMYYSDDFKHPYEFRADIVVSIDAVAEKKWACISAMPSQFGDADSWQARTRPDVPQAPAARSQFLLEMVKQRNEAVANQYRSQLVALYGAERGKQVRYAEAFQISQYGRQPAAAELRKMFPID
jgi:LmbE family N-acetylglucosaminyl deacetylase